MATVGGQLRLGLYGGGSTNPTNKIAETNAFTPVVGWNTIPTSTNPSCQPGTYWTTWLPQSNALVCRNDVNGPGLKTASFTFGVMPATFPSNPTSWPHHASFYATFTQAAQPVPTTWVNSDPIPQTGLAVVLSKASLSNLGAQNKGGVIGAISIVNGTQTTSIVIGGPDAAKFAVTNGGMVPCNLIAAVDIPAGSYSITLSAT